MPGDPRLERRRRRLPLSESPGRAFRNVFAGGGVGDASRRQRGVSPRSGPRAPARPDADGGEDPGGRSLPPPGVGSVEAAARSVPRPFGAAHPPPVRNPPARIRGPARLRCAEAVGGRGAVRDGHGGGDPLRGVGAPPGRGPPARVRSAVPVPHGALPGPHHPSRRDGAHPLRESGVPPDAGGPPGADERLARRGVPPPRRRREGRRGDRSHGRRGEAGRVPPVPDAGRRRAVRGRGVVVDPVPGRSGRGPARPPRDPRHLRAKKNGGPPRREPDALHDRDARRRGRPRVQQRPRRDPGRRRASFDARRGEPPGPPVPRRDPADGEPRHGVDPAAPGVLPPGEVHARFDPAGARAVGDPPDDTDVPPSRGRALGGMRRRASAGPMWTSPR